MVPLPEAHTRTCTDTPAVPQTALASAIAAEDYPLAARVRDRLRAVSGGLAEGSCIDWASTRLPEWLVDRAERLGWKFPTGESRGVRGVRGCCGVGLRGPWRCSCFWAMGRKGGAVDWRLLVLVVLVVVSVVWAGHHERGRYLVCVSTAPSSHPALPLLLSRPTVCNRPLILPCPLSHPHDLPPHPPACHAVLPPAVSYTQRSSAALRPCCAPGLMP